MWKILHLIYVHGRPGLSESALRKAGIVCEPDTIWPLKSAGALEERKVTGRRTREYYLSAAAIAILQNCLVADKTDLKSEVEVDGPSAFVVMPFSEKWSSAVFRDLIRPAVRKAGLKCVRGDKIVRVGDLAANVWNQIAKCGVVIAEVSVGNVNVFYELGLAYALGKDTILLKQKGVTLPADFGGAHYYEYRTSDLSTGSRVLGSALRKWAKERYARGVADLSKRQKR